jgi:hypothetical protein
MTDTPTCSYCGGATSEDRCYVCEEELRGRTHISGLLDAEILEVISALRKEGYRVFKGGTTIRPDTFDVPPLRNTNVTPVTKLSTNVTPLRNTNVTGRPRVHSSSAERQRAYRVMRGGDGFSG